MTHISMVGHERLFSIKLFYLKTYFLFFLLLSVNIVKAIKRGAWQKHILKCYYELCLLLNKMETIKTGHDSWFTEHIYIQRYYNNNFQLHKLTTSLSYRQVTMKSKKKLVPAKQAIRWMLGLWRKINILIYKWEIDNRIMLSQHAELELLPKTDQSSIISI